MKNLAHSASFHWLEKIAPSNSGIKHLVLDAYDAQLANAGPFCGGAVPGLADACLASHVAGAERFKVDLAPYPTVRRIHERCMVMPEFSRAHPLKQPGTPG